MRAIARCLLAIPAIVMLASQGADPAAAQTREIPKFEVDPSWPKLPSKYVWGQVSSGSLPNAPHMRLNAPVSASNTMMRRLP